MSHSLTASMVLGGDDPIKVSAQRATWWDGSEHFIGAVDVGDLVIQSSERGQLRRLAEALLDAEQRAEALAEPVAAVSA